MRYAILPFYDDFSKLHINNDEVYNFYPYTPFRIYSRSTTLLPFILEGTSISYVKIRDIDGNIHAELSQSDISYSVIRKGLKSYIMYNGGIINCLDLEDCKPYFLEINGKYSELFWVNDSQDLTKIELGNTNSIGDIPYNLGFKQWFWTDHFLPEPEQDIFQIQSKDEQNNVIVKYSKITDLYNLEFYDVPFFVKEVIKTFEVLDDVKLTTASKEVVSLQKQCEVKEKRVEGFKTLFSVEVLIKSDSVIEDSFCSDNVFTIQSSNTVVDKDCPDIAGIDNIISVCEDDGFGDIVNNCETDFFAEVTYS